LYDFHLTAASPTSILKAKKGLHKAKKDAGAGDRLARAFMSDASDASDADEADASVLLDLSTGLALTPTDEYVYDAQGRARPLAGALDLGAFEYVPPGVDVTPPAAVFDLR
jgi:hypothetical protein